MKIVFLILAHKNPEQLAKLVAALDSKDSYFFIHIDKKKDILPFEKVCKGNFVSFCQNRIVVNWGGFSMIEATMILINMACHHETKFDYFNLLSGQDFPLMNIESIFSIFEKNYGKNFIQCIKIPCKLSNDDGNGLERLLPWHFVDKYGFKISKKFASLQEKLRIRRRFPKGLTPYLGSQWWSLHYDCIEYLKNICNRKNKLYNFYRYTFVPDEMLFQTFIMNSQFKETVENNNMRLVNWHGIYVKELSTNDWNKIKTSKHLFGRKFDISVDADIIKYLDMNNNKEKYRRNIVQKKNNTK